MKNEKRGGQRHDNPLSTSTSYIHLLASTFFQPICILSLASTFFQPICILSLGSTFVHPIYTFTCLHPFFYIHSVYFCLDLLSYIHFGYFRLDPLFQIYSLTSTSLNPLSYIQFFRSLFTPTSLFRFFEFRTVLEFSQLCLRLFRNLYCTNKLKKF